MTPHERAAQKEKLIITLVLDELPAGDLPLSFSVNTVQDLWISRFKWFKEWKRVIYTPVPITNLKVEKLSRATSLPQSSDE